eukprot:7233098-Pyramimonas_sp.AAC.1
MTASMSVAAPIATRSDEGGTKPFRSTGSAAWASKSAGACRATSKSLSIVKSTHLRSKSGASDHALTWVRRSLSSVMIFILSSSFAFDSALSSSVMLFGSRARTSHRTDRLVLNAPKQLEYK